LISEQLGLTLATLVLDMAPEGITMYHIDTSSS
jgi:hypothetical protein